MASFSTFISKLLGNEGGYANNPADKGGETYRGISRNYNPTWSGWTTIDTRKPIANNKVFPDLESQVLSFYQKKYWNALSASLIKSQEVAELIVDWFVNGGFSTKKLQQLLVDSFGQKIAVDGDIGPITIQAINSVNQKKLWEKIMELRKKYYQDIVDSNPSQSIFHKGWMNRLASFSAPVAAGGVGLLLGVGTVFLGLKILGRKKKKK